MPAMEAEPARPATPLSLLASAAAWAGYAFLILPSLVVIPLSFGSGNEMVFPPSSYSLEQYRKYFYEANWLDATLLSFRLAAITAVASLLIGIPAAYGVVRGGFPGKQALLVFLLSPVLVPVIVIALGLYLYLSAIGLAGTATGLVMGHSLIAIPFVIVTAVAGLRHVDANLETAGAIMGAGPLRVFRTITLPLLRPAIFAGGLFAFLISFDEVVISTFISRAGFGTLPVKMFGSIQWEISPVLAAISTLLTVLTLAICLLGAALQRNS